jgi:hypothetical protein
MNCVSLVAVSQLLQCGCVTCCSWQYEMYTDVPLCHRTQTLIYVQEHIRIWLLYVDDGYVAYSTTVYQLLISCNTEVTLETCREYQRVATRYKNLHWHG